MLAFKSTIRAAEHFASNLKAKQVLLRPFLNMIPATTKILEKIIADFAQDSHHS